MAKTRHNPTQDLFFILCVEGGGGFEGFSNLSYKKIKNILYIRVL